MTTPIVGEVDLVQLLEVAKQYIDEHPPSPDDYDFGPSYGCDKLRHQALVRQLGIEIHRRRMT